MFSTNKGTEENAPRSEAQIVNGRSKVGRALFQESYKQLMAQFRNTRLCRQNISIYAQLIDSSRTIRAPINDQFISPLGNMRTFSCIYCSLVLFFALETTLKMLIYTR